MITTGFPRHHVSALHDLAARVLERRGPTASPDTLARDLLVDFVDTCARWGLDGVMAVLAQKTPALDLTDPLALADDPALAAALATKLTSRESFDPRGPAAAKPRQLAECLLATLDLPLVDEPDRTISLPDRTRAAMVAALTAVLDAELAANTLRAATIGGARARCDAAHQAAFEKIVAQLDDRGVRMLRQPKVPLHSAQAVNQALTAARTAIVEAAVRTAIQRALPELAAASAEAAARIDQPVTLRATPREIAIRRACDPRASTTPATVVQTVLDALTQLASITWEAVEQPVRPYSAKETFFVGELVEHPKFGRGSVIACALNRIDVEFPDGKLTLVHAPAK